MDILFHVLARLIAYRDHKEKTYYKRIRKKREKGEGLKHIVIQNGAKKIAPKNGQQEQSPIMEKIHNAPLREHIKEIYNSLKEI